MNTDFNSSANSPNDDVGIEQLLREVGPRDAPSADVEAAVRRAVHGEWRNMIDQRARRKRWVGYGMAAGVAAVLLSAALLFRQSPAPIAQPALVAAVVRVYSQTNAGVVQASTDGSLWRDVRAGELLKSGAQLRTDAATRAALDFGNGLSMRVDSGSLLTLASADRAELARGRIYIDAPPAHHVPLTVQTKFGEIQHLGTQYQAGVADETLVISVREGRVALAAGRDTLQVDAQESIELVVGGAVTRQSIAPNDPNWRWVALVAPAFDIENVTLADFLAWVARETGRTVRYASPQAREEAQRLILRGSVRGLNPDQALDAVLATTRFLHDSGAASIEIRLR